MIEQPRWSGPASGEDPTGPDELARADVATRFGGERGLDPVDAARRSADVRRAGGKDAVVVRSSIVKALRRQLEADPSKADDIAKALIDLASQPTRAGSEAASKVMDRVDGPVKTTLDEDALNALRPHVAIIQGSMSEHLRPPLPRSVEAVASDQPEAPSERRDG